MHSGDASWVKQCLQTGVILAAGRGALKLNKVKETILAFALQQTK